MTGLVVAGLAAFLTLWLGSSHGASRLRAALQVAHHPRGLRRAPRRLNLLGGASGATLGILVVGGGSAQPVGALVGGLLGWWVVSTLRAGPEQTRTRALQAQLPVALELLAASLAAGAPLPVALTNVTDVVNSPTKEELTLVSARIQLGSPPEQAWTELFADPVWSLPAQDLARSARSGTALAGVLRIHAADARRTEQGKREQWSRGVGIRSVLPLVCCFLPAFILVGVLPILAGILPGLLPG